MAAREGASGGTGFLFGNIDKRGRLDEDYLSDDAKDTIDNVGSKVVARDRNLEEITQAVPTAKLPDDSDDDDYDDAPADARVDYSNEVDLLEEDEMDEAERSNMAAVALKQAQKTTSGDDDDDDNYDDDDQTQDNKTKELPSLVKLPPAPKVQAQQGKKDPPKQDSAADSAWKAQQKLMMDARRMVRQGGANLKSVVPIEDDGDSPLHFSKLFTQPTPEFKYLEQRRRTFGISVEVNAAQASENVEKDDAEDLDRPQTPNLLDPFKVLLDKDKEAMELVNPPKKEERKNWNSPSTVKMEAQPSVVHTRKTDIDQFALVEQTCWEEDIAWDDGKNCDEDWYGKEEMLDAGKPDKVMKDGEEDEDEDEFEDPVDLNFGNSSNQKSGNSEKEKEDEDSDDDMEWEDGNEASNRDATEPKKEESVQKPAPKFASSSHVKSGPPKFRAVPPPSRPSSSASEKGGSIAIPRSVPVSAACSPRKGNQESGKVEVKSSGKVETAKKANPVILRSVANPDSKEDGKTSIVEAKEKTAVVIPTIDIITPNRHLENGSWVDQVMWDTDVSCDYESESERASQVEYQKLSKRIFPPAELILDRNDSNMVFSSITSDMISEVETKPVVEDTYDWTKMRAASMKLINSSGTQVQQLLAADHFNISADIFYASGTSNFLKVDRRSILRGLQNAPPVVKCQTTRTIPTKQELLSFHRPYLISENLPRNMTITPFRRKRPKGGHAQIAGQIPKKKSELYCSEKDAYRVSLYEYALERRPCILPIPGMASRIVTYERKGSALDAAQAMKTAAGTAQADTVFMAPDELPPLHAGDLEADSGPLCVVESHIFAAPCVRKATPSNDFLLVRNGKNMYVREIDSVISLGVTEPKVEVMAPNSDRFKKYSRERAVLWVIREFIKTRKEVIKQMQKRAGKEIPITLEKERIMEVFGERKTYSEAVLFKMVKEFTKYHNGKYTLIEDPNKSLGTREAELLRTVNPQETAAFESMEAGWEDLLDRGINIFTHPSNQGNILGSAERSGLEAGPAVGTYIKSQLLRTPWYRSQNIISAQRQQRKDLLQVLSFARIVNDLKEGGSVMESRLMSLTGAEMNNVLINHFRVNHKKVPNDVDDRRHMVRDMVQNHKKGKGPSQDLSDYPKLIANVLKKNRANICAKHSSSISQSLSTNYLGMPLEVQRGALDDGEVEDLQVESTELASDIDTAAALSATGDAAFGKRPSDKGKEAYFKLNGKRKLPKSSQVKKQGDQKPDKEKEFTDGAMGVKKTIGPNISKTKEGKVKQTGDEGAKKKKKVTRLKVTRKVTAADGTKKSVSETVTDPEEISRLLKEKEKKEKEKKSLKKGSSDKHSSGVGGPLKVAIDMRMLQQNSKSTGKKKVASGAERKKISKKSASKPAPPLPPSDSIGVTAAITRKPSEKSGSIGKVKINTKQLRKEKEQAALKRKRSQYGDDLDYRAKKIAKSSRRKRNGHAWLNGMLEQVEQVIRRAKGYIAPDPNPKIIIIKRLKDGESPPAHVAAKNLAAPEETGLDFTVPVDPKAVPTYRNIIKKPMYLNLIRQQCKRMEYKTSEQFLDDMRLLAKNAKDFNHGEAAAWVVQHANLLLDIAEEQISLRKEDIKAAEELIKQEKADPKAPLSKSKSKKSSSKKSQSKKNQNKNKKGNPPEVIDVDMESRHGSSQVPITIDIDAEDVDDPAASMDNASPGLSSVAIASPIDANPSPTHGASPAMIAAEMTGEMADDIYALSADGANGGNTTGNIVLDLDDAQEE